MGNVCANTLVTICALGSFGPTIVCFAQQKDPTAPTVISQDGSRVITAKEKTIGIFDAATQKELVRIQGHTDVIKALALSADGKILASGAMDKTICLWDLATGRQLRRWKVANGALALLFSGDGKLLTSRENDQTLRDFDVATGQELRVYKKK